MVVRRHAREPAAGGAAIGARRARSPHPGCRLRDRGVSRASGCEILRETGIRAGSRPSGLHARGIKSARPVCAGSVNELPFADDALAAIFSADVLCHEGVDERRALRQFHRCLSQNGWLILNLPAYRWMLSRHDAAVSNIRRYTATGLRRLLQAVGFRPVYVSYWNAMLFPLMVITRKLFPGRSGAASDVKLYPRPVEMLCRAATALETALLRPWRQISLRRLNSRNRCKGRRRS